MISLSYLRAIRFNGADAGHFLHNQLSADVLGLADGQSTFACYCEPKGRVLALMLIYRHEQEYFAIMAKALTVEVVARLKIYVLRSEVNIEELNSMTVSGVYAQGEPPLLSISIAAIPIPGGSGQLVLTTDEPTSDPASAALQAWRFSELEHGILWLGSETSGQFLPQMLGMDRLGAVNFSKGCYPGQEIVARIHYLGKVKRHPRWLCSKKTIDQNAMDKIEIYCGNEAYDAVVVDCAQREDGTHGLFCVTRMEPGLSAEKFEYQGQLIPLL